MTEIFVEIETYMALYVTARTGHGFQKGISRPTERERLILSERFYLYHPFPSVLQKYKVTAFRLDSHFLFFLMSHLLGSHPKIMDVMFHVHSIYNELALAYINTLFKET